MSIEQREGPGLAETEGLDSAWFCSRSDDFAGLFLAELGWAWVSFEGLEEKEKSGLTHGRSGRKPGRKEADPKQVKSRVKAAFDGFGRAWRPQ
jgi:hypothetical protein